MRLIRVDPLNEEDIEEIGLGTAESYFANFKIDKESTTRTLLHACD